jgi:glutamate racemase
LKTVGVFDSGVGGLSVLRALQCEAPHTHWIYLADNAYAPYGDRSEQEVVERSQRITAWLTREHRLEALVVACNTATAWAIDSLRSTYPNLPIVGVEPALKTAAQTTRTGRMGVLATTGTLASERFATLRRTVEAASGTRLQFFCQPCPGLADAIERCEEAEIERLCGRFVTALFEQVPVQERMDCLVLGCTHYPFAMHVLQRLCGPGVHLIDNATPIARRTIDMVGPAEDDNEKSERPEGGVSLYATGSVMSLQEACERWLPRLHQRAVKPVQI